jgi:hypothetical protein
MRDFCLCRADWIALSRKESLAISLVSPLKICIAFFELDSDSPGKNDLWNQRKYTYNSGSETLV